MLGNRLQVKLWVQNTLSKVSEASSTDFQFRDFLDLGFRITEIHLALLRTTEYCRIQLFQHFPTAPNLSNRKQHLIVWCMKKIINDYCLLFFHRVFKTNLTVVAERSMVGQLCSAKA